MPLWTSESVTEGHPDKVADQISDAIVDAYLAQDPAARVACETLVAPGRVILAGEITSTAVVDRAAVADQVVHDIGYGDPELEFLPITIEDLVGDQSVEIAAGVDRSLEVRATGQVADDLASSGAGDQGLMFGYATEETAELMPVPIALAHRLAESLAEVRRDHTVPGLRPDGKTQVTVRYDDGVPTQVERVLVSTQHDPGASDLKELVLRHVIAPVLEAHGFAADAARVLVNPAGGFVRGGPAADAGLTGRKIIVDTYGGMARHGGGAFSGKDPSKVDRSGAYAARWVAKNVVAAGLARRCEVQVAYAIGVARPESLTVDSFGTGRIPDADLTALVSDHFDMRPAAIRRSLDLNRPIYRVTAAYGHFGRPGLDLPWERTDRAVDLIAAAGLPAG